MVSSDLLAPDADRRVAAMRDVITYRGPDEAGLYFDHRAALGHRRLSIVDLANGQQPLSNEDGTIRIVFNGEIYNHADIRRTLEGRGHRYRTRCDTETIVHAYEEWGDDCVDGLHGMFAFAIWDGRRQRLLLARDRLGIKPLYWCRAGDVLLFGSEIKALLASGLFPSSPNYAVLSEVLGTRYTSGPETLFQGISKLLPGHVLTYERGVVQTRQYWDLPVQDSTSTDAAAGTQKGESTKREPAITRDVVETFRDLLEESVRLRLMSDVPLGLFLSGGIDSSAIAALMARLVPRPIQTFSVAFEERAYNELEHARVVARAVGAQAHEIVINDRDFFHALPKLVWHEDEPIAHPSSVPLYFVSKLARRHVKVVLTGEGSDELLGGYGKYARITWNWRAGTVYERLLPAVVRHAIARRVIPQLPAQLGRYASRSFLAMERSPETMWLDNFAAVPLRDQQRLLAPAQRDRATPTDAYGSSTSYFALPDGCHTLLSRLLYADVKTYLVELLMKQDQMSMAASIESRVPFLDHKLVEFASGLPDRWKLQGWTTKRVLRKAMQGLLPAAILNRPKMGFPVPFAKWMARRWNGVARDVLLDRRCRERGLTDSAAVDRLLVDHANRRVEAGDRIWSLLNLELWHRTFIDRDGIQTLA